MERDFMGLSTKDVVVVKEEPVEGCKDSALSKGQQVQWPSPNAFNSSTKCNSGDYQDVKALPSSNQGVSLFMNNHFFKAQIAGAAQNFTASSTQSHFVGGIPISVPHPMFPSSVTVAGTAVPWLNLTTSQASAQMTVFYRGSVNVFDDISPEKAQAIMLLAGIGSTTCSNVGKPGDQVQALSSKPVGKDVIFVNQHNKNTPPCSGLSSPTSVSSHPVGNSGVEANNNDEVGKVGGASTPHLSKAEAPKMMISHASPMIQLAVPQARNASLARFLAKRKERVMSSAPYNKLPKNSAECSTPESNGISFSRTSALASTSISTGKDNI